ncbi:hypothetical protein HanIR_Chr16g0842331 [Helianthus annuus]|nr:hypothetical protein HanIR_Chr16g0842331 [Helianthus annuus]
MSNLILFPTEKISLLIPLFSPKYRNQNPPSNPPTISFKRLLLIPSNLLDNHHTSPNILTTRPTVHHHRPPYHTA